MKYPLSEAKLLEFGNNAERLSSLIKEASKDKDERRVMVLSRLLSRQMKILARNMEFLLGEFEQWSKGVVAEIQIHSLGMKTELYHILYGLEKPEIN